MSDEFQGPAPEVSLTPRGILTALSETVVGQEDAKKALSILGYNHYVRVARDRVFYKEDEVVRLTGLIMGPTGTGKTLMCEELGKLLNLPFFKIDCTTLCQPGWKGLSIYDFLGHYILKYDSDPWMKGLLDYGIIYLDEFDKLGGKGTSDNHGVHATSTQQTLLTVLDGSEVDITLKNGTVRKLDTKKMLFILSGAFEGVYNERTNNSGSIGFNASLKDSGQTYLKPLTVKEIAKAGMIKELLGRISVVTSTGRLSKEHIKRIITEPKNNILSQYKTLFKLGSAATLEITDAIIDKIVDKVFEQEENLGIRYIKSLLFLELQDLIMELQNPTDYYEKTVESGQYAFEYPEE